jgi:hypothetical protein
MRSLEKSNLPNSHINNLSLKEKSCNIPVILQRAFGSAWADFRQSILEDTKRALLRHITNCHSEFLIFFGTWNISLSKVCQGIESWSMEERMSRWGELLYVGRWTLSWSMGASVPLWSWDSKARSIDTDV